MKTLIALAAVLTFSLSAAAQDGTAAPKAAAPAADAHALVL